MLCETLDEFRSTSWAKVGRVKAAMEAGLGCPQHARSEGLAHAYVIDGFVSPAGDIDAQADAILGCNHPAETAPNEPRVFSQPEKSGDTLPTPAKATAPMRSVKRWRYSA